MQVFIIVKVELSQMSLNLKSFDSSKLDLASEDLPRVYKSKE